MEYTVGSIADLISGKNTANKPKVVKKQIQKSSPNKRKAESVDEVEVSKPKKAKKKVSDNSDLKGPLIGKGNKKLKKRKVQPVYQPDSNQNIAKGGRKLKEKNKEFREQVDDIVTELTESKTLEGKKTPKHNAERRIQKKEKEERLEDPEIAARTIFVGNVPLGMSKKNIKKIFGTYGAIETIRFRGLPVADPNVPKKVAAIKQEFHPNRKSCISYIRFANPEDAEKAQAVDGSVFNEHHLRVQLCSFRKSKQDETKAIFVGNIPFDAEDEDLWKLFEDCGSIASTRIIRDPRTGMGKGFAYINFKDADSVQLALEMENVKLKNRELRIALSDLNGAKRKRKLKNQNKSNTKAKLGEQKKSKPSKLSLEKKKKIKKIAPRDK